MEPDLDSLLAPGRTLRAAGDGLVSALAPGTDTTSYDRHASTYDRVIGNAVYNRIAWGADTADYGAFAREALAAGRGPFLDCGCGTAVFTAEAYRAAARPLVLVDLSTAMLARAQARLDGAPARLVQADALDLPFAPGAFGTVASFAILHVLDDPWAVLRALRDQAAPGARVFVSMLVRDRPASAALLRLLRRAGEAGPARSAAELEQAGREVFGPQAAVTRRGAMAYLRA